MFSFEQINNLQAINDSPSPIEHHSDDFPDDFDGQDVGEAGKRRNRSRGTTTAERRATHNAVERARRETLNTRFQDLANALPNMANVKRPSKSAIVNKSIDYVQTSQARERALMQQNEALRKEVDELRARLGLAPATPPTAAPATLPAPRAREHSISSIHTTSHTTSEAASSPSLLGGSPPSAAAFEHNSYAAAALLPATSYFGGASSYNDRRSSDSGSVSVGSPANSDVFKPTAQMVQSQQQPAFTMAGAAELGYWMGMQQPQNHALVNAFFNMQAGQPQMPAWQTPFPAVPVPAVGGDALNWMFA